MMSWRKSIVVGVVALPLGTTVFASTHGIHHERPTPQQDATAVASKTRQPSIERSVEGSPVGIAGVRLGSSPPGDENAALLKFRMSNLHSTRLTDIVFEVSIVEEHDHEHADLTRRVVGGPFVIRGKFVLDPGDTADCEIRLRNMSPTCKCDAKVRVLSFRPIDNSGP